MGLFDSVKKAVSKTAHTVTKAVVHPVETAKQGIKKIEKAVEKAPAKLATGAHNALAGVKHLEHKAATTVKKVAHAPIEAAKAGVKAIKHVDQTVKKAAAKLVPKIAEGIHQAKNTALAIAHDPISAAKKGATAIGHAAKVVAPVIADAAKASGKWAWEHKAEIGFWVGTTALMLAVPLTAGGSGALAGGMMAARAATIAARVATMGKTGATAVRLAEAGVTALRGAQAAGAATKAGVALSKGSTAVKGLRIAMGGTKAGKVALAAAKPVGTAFNVVSTANFGEAAYKRATGTGSTKDLLMAGLFAAPAAAGVASKVGAVRSAGAEAKAARVAFNAAGDVSGKVASAKVVSNEVAFAAPRAAAPQTAQAASTAAKGASSLENSAGAVRTQAANGGSSAATLRDEYAKLAAKSHALRSNTAATENLAPEGLTPAATTARQHADSIVHTVDNAQVEIARLATTSERAKQLESTAVKTQAAAGNLGLGANVANNVPVVVKPRNQPGAQTTSSTISTGKSIAWLLLGANGKAAMPTPVP